MKKKNKMIQRWRNRILYYNRNLLMIICGATGTGKSYSALTIAKLINPKFDVNKHVVFDVESFMKLLNSKKVRRGDVIVWDEAGVGIPAREWYSISNKAINYVLQTFRHLNLCVIFTTPSFDYVDKQTRLLFHVYIETVKIDRKNKRVICKVMENQFNPAMGKEYKKYFWVNGKKMERFNIGKPTKTMQKNYEQLKKDFSEDLRKTVEKDVTEVKDKERAKRLTNEDIIEQLKADGVPKDLLESKSATVGWIQAKYRCGKDRAYFCARSAHILT